MPNMRLLEHLLRMARAQFDRDGRVGALTGARLVGLGVDVGALEERWAP
jgi:hypothetical protein